MPFGPTRAQIEALFVRQRVNDPIGIKVHDAFAMLACFLAGWPTTWVEWAPLPVLACFLIRLTGHRHVPGPLMWDRLARLIVACGGFVLLSWLWTVGEGRDWLGDVQSLRFGILILAIYPVLDRRPWLLFAVLAGITCGQLSQLADIVGQAVGWAWLEYRRMPGRISGWWDPVVGGSILCAGLGLWLAPTVLIGARGSSRTAGVVGTLGTLACIALTGTRGAWIAAGGLVVAALALGTVQRWRSLPGRAAIGEATTPRLRSHKAAFAALGLLVTIAAGWAAMSIDGPIRVRAERGISEIGKAIHQGDYSSDTGMRLGMWRWSLIEAAQSPIVGVGAGGFRPAAERTVATHGDVAALPPLPHAHAHSMYFHTLATLGGVGLVGLLTMLGVAIWSGLQTADWGKDAKAGRRLGSGSPWLTGWAGGPALALLGLCLAGVFDTVTVNQQTASMMCVLLTLCLPSRPSAVGESGLDPEAAAKHLTSSTP